MLLVGLLTRLLLVLALSSAVGGWRGVASTHEAAPVPSPPAHRLRPSSAARDVRAWGGRARRNYDLAGIAVGVPGGAPSYQAYGATESDYRPESWGSFREDLRFTGKEDDLDVGLTYFGARYYSPMLGRWLSADPLAVHTGGADPNVYAYVRGHVYSATDPTGPSTR